MDKDRILKLLELTRSDNDNEVLLSINLANRKVGNWNEFFGMKESELRKWRVALTGKIRENNTLKNRLASQESRIKVMESENARNYQAIVELATQVAYYQQPFWKRMWTRFLFIMTNGQR